MAPVRRVAPLEPAGPEALVAQVTAVELGGGPGEAPGDALHAAVLAVAHGWVAAGTATPERLTALREAVLGRPPSLEGGRLRLGGPTRAARKLGGAFHTPPHLVARLVATALDPAIAEARTAADPEAALLALRVLDPACGTGTLLVAAAQRIGEALARARQEPGSRRRVPPDAVRAATADVVARCLLGVEVDPLAADLCRLSLAVAAGDAGLVARVVTGDALLGATREHTAYAADREAADAWCADRLGRSRGDLVHWPFDLPETTSGVDVVLANPPFQSRLDAATALGAGERALVRALHPGVGPLTDVSALFLLRTPQWLRPGGRAAVLQPLSVLAARDAAPARAAVLEAGALTAVLAGAALDPSAATAFAGAHVDTCVVGLRAGVAQGAVRTGAGRAARPGATRLARGWGFLAAGALGVPTVRLRRGGGTVGDLAEVTADFRDEYYGLEGHVRDVDPDDLPPGHAPLVTTGVVDPLVCDWGRRPATVHGRAWRAPAVDLASLGAEPARAAWASRRRVPKVLLAGQARVLEPVSDPTGAWLPSVPLLTLAAPADVHPRLLAVLLSPPLVAHAAALGTGTALRAMTLRLGVRQVAELPLPCDPGAWDDAAAMLAEHRGPAAPALLRAIGALGCRAYGRPAPPAGEEDPLLVWWWDRLPRASSGPEPG